MHVLGAGIARLSVNQDAGVHHVQAMQADVANHADDGDRLAIIKEVGLDAIARRPIQHGSLPSGKELEVGQKVLFDASVFLFHAGVTDHLLQVETARSLVEIGNLPSQQEDECLVPAFTTRIDTKHLLHTVSEHASRRKEARESIACSVQSERAKLIASETLKPETTQSQGTANFDQQETIK